jgi:hypothetical protein
MWRDDDSRVRSGKWPTRTCEVLAVAGRAAVVKWVETGKTADISIARFGRRGRLLPLNESASTTQPDSTRASGIQMRDASYPAREAVLALVSRNAAQFADWQALLALIPKALEEARMDERHVCLAEAMLSFTLKGAQDNIRHGLPKGGG